MGPIRTPQQNSRTPKNTPGKTPKGGLNTPCGKISKQRDRNRLSKQTAKMAQGLKPQKLSGSLQKSLQNSPKGTPKQGKSTLKEGKGPLVQGTGAWVRGKGAPVQRKDTPIRTQGKGIPVQVKRMPIQGKGPLVQGYGMLKRGKTTPKFQGKLKKDAVDAQPEKVKNEEKENKDNGVAEGAVTAGDGTEGEGDGDGDGDGEPPSKMPRIDDDSQRADELEKNCPYVIIAHNVPKLAKVNDMYQNLEGFINLQDRKVKLFFKTEEACKKVLFDPPVFPNLKVNYTTEPQHEMYVVGIPCEIPKNDVSKELSDALSAKGVYYVSVVRGFGQKNLGHAVLRLVDEESKKTLMAEGSIKLFSDTKILFFEEEDFKKKFAVSVSNLHVSEKFAKHRVVDLEKKLEELGAKDSGMLFRFPNIEIYFTKKKDATKALQLDGKELNGRCMTTRRLSEKSFRMIITGLAAGIRENHLRELMEGITILALEMRKTGTYVEVPTEEDRQKLLALHQTPLEGKRIMVLYDEPSFYQPLTQEKLRKMKKKKPDGPGSGIYRGSSSTCPYRGGLPRGGGGGGGGGGYYRNTPNWGAFGGPPSWQGFNNRGFHVQDNYNYYAAQGGYGGGGGYRSDYPSNYGYRGGGSSSGMARGYGYRGSGTGYMRGSGGGSRGYGKRGSGGGSGRGYRGRSTKTLPWNGVTQQE